MQLSAGKKDFLSTFLLVVVYAGCFYALQFFLYTILMVPRVPTEANLITWDAGFYQKIAFNGYDFKGGNSPSLAFFPLFPVVWGLTHVGVWGICIINILFLAAGFSILCSIYKVNTQTKILWLSIPAIYFAFIPYTEALFFLLSSVLIFGIKTKKVWLIWLSLILLSLTRASGTFLAPALLAMSLLSSKRERWYKSIFSYLVTYLAPIVIGTAVFVVYQYLKTGVWFAFFNVQKEYWGRGLRMPVLPFYNYSGPPLLWIQALAMFVGFFCFFFLMLRFIKWLFRNIVQDELLIASCTFLLMALLVVILYNPRWGGDCTTTNVSCIFRFTLMNPFFYIFLFHFTNVAAYKWQHYVLVFFLANIVWLSFGSYVHLEAFLFYTTGTILIFLYMLLADKKLTWPIMVLVAFNIFVQIHFFQQFIGVQFLPD